MPPQVCWRCRQTYHDDDPRWGCACGPARPTALPPAVTHVANDDPATWYDAFTCYPPDGDLEALPWL